MTTEIEPTELNWSQIIADWEQSGLTQTEFCRQRGLSYNSFSYQKSKRTKKESRTSFLKINVSKNTAGEMPSITIILPDQTRLIVPSDRHSLLEVFSALRAIAC